jgi:hypothetical protein
MTPLLRAVGGCGLKGMVNPTGCPWKSVTSVARTLMEDVDKLGGIVEVDETSIGGKDKNRHWDKREHNRGTQ